MIKKARKISQKDYWQRRGLIEINGVRFSDPQFVHVWPEGVCPNGHPSKYF
jgi:hypothetical protein